MPAKKKDTPERARRFVDRKELVAAVRSWCLAELETRSPWIRVVASSLNSICHSRSPNEDEARDIYFRLRDAVGAAEEYLARTSARRPVPEGAPDLPPGEAALGYYASQVERATTAVRAACPSIHGVDYDITSREKIIAHVEMVRRPPWKPAATDREIAILSLLAGNGLDWMTKATKRAKDTQVRTHRPTVLDVVRAEDKAIALARKRRSQRIKTTKR